MGVPSPLNAPSASPLKFLSSDFPTLGALKEAALDSQVCESPPNTDSKKRVLKSNPSWADTKDSNASQSGDEHEVGSESPTILTLDSEQSLESRSSEAEAFCLEDSKMMQSMPQNQVAPPSADDLLQGKGVMRVDASELVGYYAANAESSIMQLLLCRIRHDENSGMRIEPCTGEDVQVDSEHEVFWCSVQQQLDGSIIITPCIDPAACGIELDANSASLLPTEDIVGAPMRPPQGSHAPAWVYGSQWPFCVAPTTLILSDLPNDLLQEDLVEILDKEGFSGFYDFLYLPMDSEFNCNMGHAIVNLTQHGYGLSLSALVHGRSSWCGTPSSPCKVSWSISLQGVEQLLEHYQVHVACRGDVPSDMRPTWFSSGWPHPLPLEN